MTVTITPEQREAALEILRTQIWAAAGCAIPEPWEVGDFFAPITLNALIAAGWGPVADAEARGYRAGVEAAGNEVAKEIDRARTFGPHHVPVLAGVQDAIRALAPTGEGL